jgi:hypothetical protein
VRAKLALLAVTALVFAPGWGTDPAPHDAGATELAGRILAPTVDEASSISQLDPHRQQRGKLRSSYAKEFASMPTGTQLLPDGDLWVAVLVTICISVLTGNAYVRPARGPPHLVTV